MLLKPAYSQQPLQHPRSWNELAAGERIRQQTESVVKRAAKRVRPGVTAVLGPLATGLDCQSLALRPPLSFAADVAQPGIRCDIEHLPIKNNVLDNIVLPFVLEFSRDPHQILRECNRTLADDGYLLMTGFNPLSPAIFGGWFASRGKQFPWVGRYFSTVRVRDWLSLLGYEIVDSHYFIADFWLGSQHSVRAERICKKLPALQPAYLSLIHI